jgi:hypothetical protein
VNYGTQNPHPQKTVHKIESSGLQKLFILICSDILEDNIRAKNILQRHYRFLKPTSEAQKKTSECYIKFVVKYYFKNSRQLQEIYKTF